MMSEIDLYTSPQLISIGIFCVLIGFCLGNIFQIQMRKTKTKMMRKEEIKSLLIMWESFNNGVDNTIKDREKIEKKLNEFLDKELWIYSIKINQNKDD